MKYLFLVIVCAASTLGLVRWEASAQEPETAGLYVPEGKSGIGILVKAGSDESIFVGSGPDKKPIDTIELDDGLTFQKLILEPGSYRIHIEGIPDPLTIEAVQGDVALLGFVVDDDRLEPWPWQDQGAAYTAMYDLAMAARENKDIDIGGEKDIYLNVQEHFNTAPPFSIPRPKPGGSGDGEQAKP